MVHSAILTGHELSYQRQHTRSERKQTKPKHKMDRERTLCRHIKGAHVNPPPSQGIYRYPVGLPLHPAVP